MSKTRKIDHKHAIEKATLLFWEKGYKQTSMEDLVKATGLSRYSFYESFGSKHAIFLDAMDYYLDEYIRQDFAEFFTTHTPLEHLEEIMFEAIDFIQTEDGEKGCFLYNTDPSLIREDKEIAEKVLIHQKFILSAFSHAIKAAQNLGQLRSDVQADEFANVFYIMLKGILTSSHTPIPEETLRSATRATFAALKS